MSFSIRLKNVDLPWNEARADFYRETFNEDERGDLHNVEIDICFTFDYDGEVNSIKLFEVFEGRTASLDMEEYLENNEESRLYEEIYENYQDEIEW